MNVFRLKAVGSPEFFSLIEEKNHSVKLYGRRVCLRTGSFIPLKVYLLCLRYIFSPTKPLVSNHKFVEKMYDSVRQLQENPYSGKVWWKQKIYALLNKEEIQAVKELKTSLEECRQAFFLYRMIKNLLYAMEQPATQASCSTFLTRKCLQNSASPKKGLHSFVSSVQLEEAAGYKAQGVRSSMQDDYIVNPTQGIFGVIDGHGPEGMEATEFFKGRLVASFADALAQVVTTEEKKEAEAAFTLFKDNFIESHESYSGEGGACALMVAVGKKYIYFCNVGDCRAILVQPDSVLQVTEDQKLTVPRFHKEVGEKRGLNIENGRVLGLDMARSLGDIHVPLKATPKISCLERTEIQSGSFLVLVTDGVTKKATTEQIGELVKNLSDQNEEELAKALVQRAISAGSKDNATAVVIRDRWLGDPKRE